jgi:hypothetical protein
VTPRSYRPALTPFRWTLREQDESRGLFAASQHGAFGHATGHREVADGRSSVVIVTTLVDLTRQLSDLRFELQQRVGTKDVAR